MAGEIKYNSDTQSLVLELPLVKVGSGVVAQVMGVVPGETAPDLPPHGMAVPMALNGQQAWMVLAVLNLQEVPDAADEGGEAGAAQAQAEKPLPGWEKRATIVPVDASESGSPETEGG